MPHALVAARPETASEMVNVGAGLGQHGMSLQLTDWKAEVEHQSVARTLLLTLHIPMNIINSFLKK